jgi:zinc protease
MERAVSLSLEELIRKSVYSSFEKAYNERDKTESEQLVSEYIRNFLTGEPIPGIEYEFGFVKEYLDGISLSEINDIARRMLSVTTGLLG